MEYNEFRAMNTTVVLAVEGKPEKAASAFERTRHYIEEAEQRFSRFLAQSELTRLNLSQGEWFEASPDLYAVLKLAQSYFYQTGGLFDPSILPDLKRLGYDRSMDEIKLAERSAAEVIPVFIWRPQPRTGFGELQLEGSSRRIWMPEDMEIDLGGIAKGWIAEQAAQILIQDATACAVNTGGDMVLLGLPAGQKAWEIGLEDPRNPETNLAVLAVRPGAVATSSVVKRSWQRGGRQRHHLIDPRSGEPAVTSWLSVTVYSPQAASAEVFAKALLIAGANQAAELVDGNPDIAYIAVDEQGKLWGSPNSKEFFYANK
jgi:thiamine biosynthesis lipoprotein